METKEEYLVNNSDSISELIKALCRAKRMFKPITRDAINPFLKNRYATLDAIVNATESALSDNGLVIIHHQELIEDNKFLVTELIHESGQSKSTETCMNEYLQSSEKGMTPIQRLGSTITYLKRYQISELLNVAIDEDTDGNNPDAKGKKNPSENIDDNLDKISEQEIAQILANCKELGLESEIQALNKVKAILKSNIKSLAELTMPEFAEVIKSLGSSKIPPKPPVNVGINGSDNGNGSNDNNRKRAFAIANRLLMSDEEIKADILREFGFETRKDMTEDHWKQYCDLLLSYEKKMVTDEQVELMKSLPKPYRELTQANFLTFVNSNLEVAKSKTKNADGSPVVHVAITKPEYMSFWEADYIIRVLKVNQDDKDKDN